MSNAQDSQEIIDINKLNRMKLDILDAERRNVGTREKTNPEMVELIKRTIVTFADKTF